MSAGIKHSLCVPGRVHILPCREKPALSPFLAWQAQTDHWLHTLLGLNLNPLQLCEPTIMKLVFGLWHNASAAIKRKVIYQTNNSLSKERKPDKRTLPNHIFQGHFQTIYFGLHENLKENTQEPCWSRPQTHVVQHPVSNGLDPEAPRELC